MCFCLLQLMRFEFTNPSLSRPATTFNFNYERQASLNKALLHEAQREGAAARDLPPSERPVRKVWPGVLALSQTAVGDGRPN